ncbi:hypothetical protein CCR95_07040 [Thiocystis minor]|uniref:hypothetical protein n=1 Tax=Thiocystis minor TaxID=61597 RepID=UPI0019126777|nr:hypothetical protein [Thiocystis minor]MBK5963847.1 hypothetical protein [Thiocystis minor]
MNHQHLYYLNGSCIGHENAERRRHAVLAWLGLPCAVVPLGTDEHLQAYQKAMRLGEAHHAKTGKRCPALLTPELIGLEDARVAILDPEGRETRRFWVSRSTGWMPVHLSIPRITSHGGFPVDLDPGDQVRIVRRTRIGR